MALAPRVAVLEEAAKASHSISVQIPDWYLHCHFAFAEEFPVRKNHVLYVLALSLPFFYDLIDVWVIMVLVTSGIGIGLVCLFERIFD